MGEELLSVSPAPLLPPFQAQTRPLGPTEACVPCCRQVSSLKISIPGQVLPPALLQWSPEPAETEGMTSTSRRLPGFSSCLADLLPSPACWPQRHRLLHMT